MQDFNPIDVTASKKDTFDVREFLEKYVFHWKWFVLGVIVAIFCAFLILRYTVPEFQVVSTILIQDKENESVSSELSAFEDLGLSTSGKSMFNTEIGVLNSRSL